MLEQPIIPIPVMVGVDVVEQVVVGDLMVTTKLLELGLAKVQLCLGVILSPLQATIVTMVARVTVRLLWAPMVTKVVDCQLGLVDRVKCLLHGSMDRVMVMDIKSGDLVPM